MFSFVKVPYIPITTGDNIKFAISLHYLKKEGRDEVDFFAGG